MASRSTEEEDAAAGPTPAEAAGAFAVETRPAAPVTPPTPSGGAVRDSRIEVMAREALMSSPLPSVRTAEAPRADRSRSLAGPVQPPWSPLEVTLEVMDDRWKTLIVWRLFWGAKPFCELMRCTRGLTKKTLRHALAEMERHGLVRKEVRLGQGRRAEYALTPYGQTLKPIVGAMYEWGLQHGLAVAPGSAPS